MPDVALITGTSKGIGAALVKHFLTLNYTVIGCSRSASSISAPNYRHFILDVCDEEAVKKMFSTVRKDYGRLDVLVNNAGIAAMNHAMLTPSDTVKNILNTNVLAGFICCREAAKLMKKNRFGRIVNFSTVAVPLNLEGEAVYAASKAAMESLTKILAREFAEFGITVNAIGPTPIETDLIKNVSPDKINKLIERQALKRLGTFDDVVNVIDFYIDKNSDFVSAQVVYLGGV